MRVLVTGAGSGIGAATARVLTVRGHDVVATARRVEALDHLDVAATLALDVTDDDSVAACVAAAGEIDVLVNNAGISETGPLESYPHDVLQKMFDTNVFGPMRMVRALVPPMRERGRGVLVNVTSVQGRVATPLAGAYCATKHASRRCRRRSPWRSATSVSGWSSSSPATSRRACATPSDTARTARSTKS